MRIINYGVRDDEIPFFKKYAQEFGIECATTSKPLNKETVILAHGFDAVTDIKPREYGAEVYSKLKEFGIKYFSLRCAGFDGLDKELADEYGINFARVPSYSPNAVAEYAVALSLMLIRNLHIGYARFKNQDYRIDNLIGKEIRDYTVGIIGTGNIGTLAAKIFQSFGAEVIAYDKNPTLTEELEYVSTEELFKRANLISLHTPLTDDTYHLIDREAIKLMQDGTIIVNTARGAEIDSEALYEGLTSGKIAGAALDVYEFEEEFYQKDMTACMIEDELFRKIESLNSTIITPHMAFNTYRAVENMVKGSLANIKEFCLSGSCSNKL